MTGHGVDYVTLDQWVHLAAEVLGSDAATIRRTADQNLIDSALHAPTAGFGEQDLYPDVIDKASVLCRAPMTRRRRWSESRPSTRTSPGSPDGFETTPPDHLSRCAGGYPRL